MSNAFGLDLHVLNSAPPHWERRPLWTIVRRRDVTGRPDAELLSVYRDFGVVPRNSREDNYNKPSEDLSTYRYVRPGDLVLNKMKTWQGSLGVSQHEGIVSPAYFVCEMSHEVDPRYAHHLLRSEPYIHLYRAASKGIRPNQWDLPFDEFRQLPILLPPLEEQRRIAAFLDRETTRVDTLIETQSRFITRLSERRTAAITAAVTGRHHTDRRASSLAWLETLPTAWMEVRLNLVAKMGSGHTPSRLHPEWWEDCNIPWITTGEVSQVRNDRVEDLHETRERISEVGLANSSAELHPKGTVFLCRTAASAGYSGVMGLPMATSQDIVTWTCGPRLDPYYLLWCLRAMRPDLLGRLAMGSTHKTIYVPDLQMLRIPLPPTDEQQQIVRDIRTENARLDALSDKVRHQSELFRERRQALITAAVTGQFDVTTASGRNVTEGITA
ncbi:restriction endonuclease subunit S [Streptomyces pseudogriseolus]|uniref:restriction endonuclease subunit S n=1 Tax=Streptomyces pseudogriseolus TaxID=36817 RepID=UPI003FA2CA64